MKERRDDPSSVASVVEARAEQVDDLARALAVAFHDDPLFCYVIPEAEQRARRLPGLLATTVRFGVLFGSVTTTTDVEGAAVWSPSEVSVTPERAREAGYARIGEILAYEEIVRFGSVMDRLQPVFEREMQEPHWFLNAVGVVPDRRRRGIGSALLAPVLSRADEEGSPCYLSSFQPDSIAFYRALGFEVCSDAVDAESALRYWTLRRAAAVRP